LLGITALIHPAVLLVLVVIRGRQLRPLLIGLGWALLGVSLGWLTAWVLFNSSRLEHVAVSWLTKAIPVLPTPHEFHFLWLLLGPCLLSATARFRTNSRLGSLFFLWLYVVVQAGGSWADCSIMILGAALLNWRVRVLSAGIVLVLFLILQQPTREQWHRCRVEGSTPGLQQQLQRERHTARESSPEDLDRVRRFLQSREDPLLTGQLLVWNPSAISLYSRLGLLPPLGFRSSGRLEDDDPATLRTKLLAEPIEYVVTDLAVLGGRARGGEPGREGRWDQLPDFVSEELARAFPWNQRIVFRSGRYFVHEFRRPFDTIDRTPRSR
jgi:hypothetical protein